MRKGHVIFNICIALSAGYLLVYPHPIASPALGYFLVGIATGALVFLLYKKIYRFLYNYKGGKYVR